MISSLCNHHLVKLRIIWRIALLLLVSAVCQPKQALAQFQRGVTVTIKPPPDSQQNEENQQNMEDGLLSLDPQVVYSDFGGLGTGGGYQPL